MGARKPVLPVIAVCCVLVGWLMCSAVSSFANVGFESSSFGSTGGLAGPVGLAVDNSGSLYKGDVYVVDQQHDLLDQFSAAGGTLAEVPLPAGANPNQVTVDDYPSLTEEGDVLVAGFGSGVIYRLPAGLGSTEEVVKGLVQPTAVAVDSKGFIYVSQYAGTVLKFNAAGDPVDAAGDLVAAGQNVVVSESSPIQALAVNAAGDIYLATETGTSEYAPSGGLYEQATVFNTVFSGGVTLSSSGDVLVDQGNEIAEYVPTGGTPLVMFGGGVLSGAYGVGVNNETGEVYVTDNSSNVVYAFTEGATPEAPVSEPAVVNGTSVVLHGELKAGGDGTSAYHFEYDVGSNCAGEGSQTTPEVSGTSGPVHATVSELAPLAEYSYCLIATNAYGSTTGPSTTFATGIASPKIEGESAVNIGSSSVTLSAQIDAGGSLTGYRVEYGTSEAYGSTTPEESVGAPTTPVGVQVELNNLQADTLYHFRFVANNTLGTIPGADATFRTTASTVASTVGLPDGRVYEMVTPSENDEADVYAPFAITSSILNAGEGDVHTRLPFQVALNGGAVAYVGAPTTGGTGSFGDAGGDQYLATRGPDGGWSQETLSPTGYMSAFYQAFSNDLSVGILESGAASLPQIPALAPGAPGEGYGVLYTRKEDEAGYQPLFSGAPFDGEVAEEFKTYNVEPTYLGTEVWLAYAGSSADLDELLFEVHGALTANAVSSPGENNLYVSEGGKVFLVNVLPDGQTEANATFGGAAGETPDFSHVISADGSRVFWTDLNTGALYMRENPVSGDARTVEIDGSQGPGSSGGGQFWTADKEGTRVFFTDENQLTVGSTAASGAPDLYEYEPESGHLTDLTVHAGEPADVQGVIGAGEEEGQDGSYVYFIAGGVLADNMNSNGAKAQAGASNLYVLRLGGEPVFIATLSGRDDSEAVATRGGRVTGDWQPGLGHRTAGVTPDGGSVVFESDNQTVDGQAETAEEVYVYDAEDGALTCASCERAGAPPPSNYEYERGMGGFLPPSWSNTYVPQWISEDGSRVFFDSTEVLVPQATNDTQNVYEWERDGSGSCVTEGGCVYLLSGGVSPSVSWLIGGSANGDDVFMVTRERLVPQDGNEAYNVFDARVDGVQAVSPPECTGTGCQGVPEPPPVFATPASVTYAGIGNFSPSIPVESKAVVVKKSLTRTQKLAKALKACTPRRSKRKRTVCEAQARKRYGPKRKAKHKAVKASRGSIGSGKGGRS